MERNGKSTATNVFSTRRGYEGNVIASGMAEGRMMGWEG